MTPPVPPPRLSSVTPYETLKTVPTGRRDGAEEALRKKFAACGEITRIDPWKKIG